MTIEELCEALRLTKKDASAEVIVYVPKPEPGDAYNTRESTIRHVAPGTDNSVVVYLS